MTDLHNRVEQADSDSLPETASLLEGFDPDTHVSLELPVPVSGLRSVWKDRRLMHHNRLAVGLILANLVVLLYGLTSGDWFSSEGIELGSIANASILNITAAILIRQQYVINLMFRVATSAPTSWPLKIRWTLGKVYHFGGIHIGGVISGSFWFAVFMGSIGYHAAKDLGGVNTPLLSVSAVMLGLLVAMIGFSLPRYRAKYHDRFERVHRFAGWGLLALFWIHIVLFAAAGKGPSGLVSKLAGSLGIWLLLAVTISIALPWMRLKRVSVVIERPSDHVALVNFDHGVTPFAGSSTTVSRNPLLEWHAFANVPSPNKSGFRLTISRSGDWTGDLIDDMPSHLWVKGITTAGVGNVDQLFKKVVWIATGSGIGPTLPHLLAQQVPAHLVWATRTPRATYGDNLVDEIQRVQPEAWIWDTNRYGKPNLVELANDAVVRFGAEAVIVISNKSLTWQVVEGMERIGVPAYGAIWDS